MSDDLMVMASGDGESTMTPLHSHLVTFVAKKDGDIRSKSREDLARYQQAFCLSLHAVHNRTCQIVG